MEHHNLEHIKKLFSDRYITFNALDRPKDLPEFWTDHHNLMRFESSVLSRHAPSDKESANTIRRYSHSHQGKLLNNALISGRTYPFHDDMKKMFEKVTPTDRETHVYSFIDWDHFVKSDHFQMPAYMSTSIDPIVTNNFLPAIGGGHILHFQLPKGYAKGVYIAPHSSYPEEKEYLLSSGQKWRRINKETINTRHNGVVSIHTLIPTE